MNKRNDRSWQQGPQGQREQHRPQGQGSRGWQGSADDSREARGDFSTHRNWREHGHHAEGGYGNDESEGRFGSPYRGDMEDDDGAWRGMGGTGSQSYGWARGHAGTSQSMGNQGGTGMGYRGGGRGMGGPGYGMHEGYGGRGAYGGRGSYEDRGQYGGSQGERGRYGQGSFGGQGRYDQGSYGSYGGGRGYGAEDDRFGQGSFGEWGGQGTYGDRGQRFGGISGEPRHETGFSRGMSDDGRFGGRGDHQDRWSGQRDGGGSYGQRWRDDDAFAGSRAGGQGGGRSDYRGYGFQGSGSMDSEERSQFRAPKGYNRSDERIREDICDRLGRTAGVDPSDVEVTVREGQVKLSGQVRDRGQKFRMETLAEEISGVKDVDNQIRVQRGDTNKSSSGGTGTGTGTGASSPNKNETTASKGLSTS